MPVRALGPLVLVVLGALAGAGCLSAPAGRGGGGSSSEDPCTTGADTFCRCAELLGAPCSAADQSSAYTACNSGLASGDTIRCFADYASNVTADGCNAALNTCTSTGTGGTNGGGGGTGGTTSDAGSCPPNNLTCGTDANGVETPCSNGLVCCFTPGPNGSTTCGTTSQCMVPGAPNGTSDQCPSGQYQLCKTSEECGTGYTCSASASGFCL